MSKAGRGLLATLTFVLGLVLGIILFFVAVAGTIVGLGTAVDVGKVQESLTTAPVIDENSTLYSSTVLEALQKLLEDVRNFDLLSLKTLYETYGIKIFNGVSGIDFTNRSFYDAPIGDIMKDFSILLSGLYLSDVGTITGVDFTSYNLPILDQNMNVGLNVAIDNIMSSLNGDLSIRAIKDNFGIDIGTADNDMLGALQDIRLADFGSTIDALLIDTLLNADTDSYLPYGANDVYVAVPESEQYEVVPDGDLSPENLFAVHDGVETYIAGGEDGKLIVREMRYYKDENGDITVNNSCYNENYEKPEGVQIMRRRLYDRYTGSSSASGEYFVKAYANRVDAFVATQGTYTLKEKEFVSLKEVFKLGAGGALTSYNGDVRNGSVQITSLAYSFEEEDETTVVEESPFFAMTDETLTKDSSLCEVEERQQKTYLRQHKGTSTPVLQKINWLSIGELRDTDDLLDSLRIGDIIEYNENTAHILVALKNSTLKSLGEDVNKLEIGDVLDLDDDSAKIMTSLANRHCTLEDLDSIADELTIGELLDIEFDEYVEAPGSGKYVRVPIYVEYNPFVTDDIYGYADGEALIKGTYVAGQDGEDGTFTPDPDGDGDYVQTFYYTLYDEKTHGTDVMRYDLQKEGATALAVQSIARRGCKMKDMGEDMNDLTIAELIRIDENSAHLFKSLAKKGETMDKLAEDANTLEIGEIILIDDDASWLMKSLDRRHCTLDDMSTITDKLSLSEMMEIVPDEFTRDEEGRYVEVLDDKSYIPYAYSADTEEEYAWRTKYVATDDPDEPYRQYVGALPAPEGTELFVHGAYYTLYNPALHATSDLVRKERDSVIRYKKTEVEGASSPLLQRFSTSSLDGFSNAFETLMLADVMDIDGDMYEPIDLANLRKTSAEPEGEEPANTWYYSATDNFDEQETVFYYDAENCVYRIAGQKEMAAAKEPSADIVLYHISQHGSAASIIKKLAYAKVDGLEGAMDAVMADLMLSEIIDINTYDAVTLVGGVDKDDYHPSANIEEEYFFVEWDGKSVINDKPVVFTYDAQMDGKYFANEFRYVLLDPGNEQDQAHLGSATTKYVQYKPLTDDIGQAAKHVSDGNVYVKNGEEYTHNVPLAAYYVGKSKTQYDKLYYREILSENQEGAVAFDSYDGTELYVDVLGKKTNYDPTNPSHLGLNIYWKETGGTFYVPIGDNNYSYEDDVRLAAKYCHDVYFSIDRADIGGTYQEDEVYVYVGGAYELYDGSKLDHTSEDAAYYIKKTGYVASLAEAFYVSDGKYVTDLDVVKVTPQRLRSSRVLVTLARETINDMDGVIKTATIGDFMEMTPGTIFDNEKIASSTIDNLGLTLQSVLSEMTIGELLEWANVTSASAEIREALKEITIDKFFAALTYNPLDGTISLNMETLYGIE